MISKRDIKNKADSIVYSIKKNAYFIVRDSIYVIIRGVACLQPLKTQICASCFSGTKYSDNTKYIVEQIHELCPSCKINWLKDPSANYQLPEYINGVNCFPEKRFIKRLWEYSTSKVIIDTHLLDSCFKKRQGQLFIETWHGGLGIKRIENDVDSFSKVRSHERKIANTVAQADFFISNSDHLTQIYKRAFGRKDNIWEIGYPKNDILVNISKDKVAEIRQRVRSFFAVDENAIIITYAPTFRDEARTKGVFSTSPYNLDKSVLSAFRQYFGYNDCHLIFKLHPYVASYSDQLCIDGDHFHNGSHYPDMQELIIGSDAFISDYSSCIFDAALFSLPCFTFANDYDDYKKGRGLYYALEELPFPFARTNEQLIKLVEQYSFSEYRKKWLEFVNKVGLCETGEASKIIAKYICDYMTNDNDK